MTANLSMPAFAWCVAAGICCLMAFGGCRKPHPQDKEQAATSEQSEGVTVPEDLMREHGVLRRVLLVYQECIRRIEAGQETPVSAIRDSATIVREFVEDYHEKLEEDYLFPRFESEALEVDLVKILRAQHEAGRRLTADIIRLTDGQPSIKPADRAALAQEMRRFIAMYQVHSAREDTVLFPDIRKVYPPREFDKLGDTFEDKEQELFGHEGFEKMVGRVASIEKGLGIYDLNQFTPAVGR